MRTIELAGGRGVALVDDADYERVAKLNWHNTTGYARSGYGADGKRVLMHRLVAGEGVGCVDHINGNKLDNRRANLRWCTQAQNARNRRMSKRGSSRYQGVSWHKASQRWQAQAMLEGQKVYLGVFKSELEAALAYDTFALTHFGEFASPNILHRLGSAVTVRLRAT